MSSFSSLEIGLLNRKLDFIRSFYELASEPIKDSISAFQEYENSEEYDPLNNDRPPVDQYNEFLNILGQSCLCLIRSTLWDYIEAFMPDNGKEKRMTLWDHIRGFTPYCDKQKRVRNPFKRAEKAFSEAYNIKFRDVCTKQGLRVPVAMLEEITLARNSIQHQYRFDDLIAYHDPAYRKRFPNSVFAKEDPLLPIIVEGTNEVLFDGVRIDVSAEGLAHAMTVVRDFCEYLDRKLQGRQKQVTGHGVSYSRKP